MSTPSAAASTAWPSVVDIYSNGRLRPIFIVSTASNYGLARFSANCGFSVLLTITALISILLINPSGLAVALPFLLAWLFAPIVVRKLDRPQQPRQFDLDDRQQRFLRTTARRTWLFFRRFVEPDNHWLPPDNYQEEPSVALARRTSPTNMGMSLNAALAAHDFGWLDLQTLIAWLANSMERMGGLDHYRGHWLKLVRNREPATAESPLCFHG